MRSNIGLILASLITSAHSRLSFQNVSSPQFDFSGSNNDQIAFLGDFDASSIYSYVGESNFTNQNTLQNQLYYSTGDNDRFITLGQINGSIDQILPVHNDYFILLGDFDGIGNQNVSSPAIFNLDSENFTSIDPNKDINGTINTAFFDSDDNLIYLGGDFEFNNSHGAAFYNLTSQNLNSTVFRGFGNNGTINSIIKIGSNIIFGGQFTNLGIPQLLTHSYNTSNTSVTTDQLVSLRYASFSSSDDSSNPEALVCPESSQEWSVSGASSATVNINLPYQVIPSKIRIYNSQDDDSQVSLFRLLTSPANGIMNLTYVDPATGDLSYCDAWCPLLNSSYLESASRSNDGSTAVAFADTSIGYSSTYQEFGFINSLDVGGLTFQALNSFGSNIALEGLQIYQSLYSTYANNTLNEPSCGISEYSRAETRGDWSSSPNGQYITSDVDVSNGIPDDLGVTFFPNITYAGEYTILMYTPGCGQDNSCSSRGVANVTIYDDSTDEILDSSLIYQTNEEEKYDLVYYGQLNSTVRVGMVLDQAGPSGNTVTFVADRISVTIFEIDDIAHRNGTIPINGLFEYSPSNFSNFDVSNVTQREYVGNTTINRLGSSLSNHSDIHLALYNNSIYVGGDFSSNYGDNLFRLDISDSNNETRGLNVSAHDVNGGLDGEVTNMKVIDNSLILLGDFNNTINTTTISSLSNDDSNSLQASALYNGSWYSFGTRINASTVSNITLRGDEFWLFGDDQRWITGNDTWYNNTLELSFNITSSGKNDNSTLFVGSLKSSDSIGNKGTFINGSGEQSNITNEEFSQSVINSGVYINNSLSVFGGEFNTSSGIRNLVFVSGNETSGVNISWASNSSVTRLFAENDRLFVGTNGSGSVDNHNFDGVFIYNLNNNTFGSTQPDGLSSNSRSPVVNELGFLNNTYLIVGGDFDSAGSVSCSGLCFYNLNETNWEALVDSFSGTVHAFRFVNDTVLIIAGDLRYDSNDLKLMSYDFNSTSHSQPDHFSQLNRTVEKFILVDNSTDGRIIVSGSDFIQAYDGSSWRSIDNELNNSTIRDISLLNISNSNDNNNGSIFDSNQVLVASGELNLTDYGYLNVAYFNSTNWLPYMITTHNNSTSTVNSIFLNKDISDLYIGGTLTNTTHPSTTSSTPSSSSSSASSGKSHHIKRGFIVLIGLALAVGTMTLLGLIAAFFIFKRKKHNYTPVEPRVNETEMLDTVPPENLFKHV